MNLHEKFFEWSVRPEQIYCDPTGFLIVIQSPRLADPQFFVALVGDGNGDERMVLLPKIKEEMEKFEFIGVVDEKYVRT
jgi:hypothetical protein